MCGIAGAVALDGREIAPGTAARMRDQILHRGPDGNGEHDAPGVSLAACRLAIVDLEPRGLMPGRPVPVQTDAVRPLSDARAAVRAPARRGGRAGALASPSARRRS
jgi:hypothetical protein